MATLTDRVEILEGRFDAFDENLSEQRDFLNNGLSEKIAAALSKAFEERDRHNRAESRAERELALREQQAEFERQQALRDQQRQDDKDAAAKIGRQKDRINRLMIATITPLGSIVTAIVVWLLTRGG